MVWHVVCRDIVTQVYAKIVELRADFKAENEKYWDLEHAWRLWNKADRTRKYAPLPCFIRMQCGKPGSPRQLGNCTLVVPSLY